MKPGDIVKVKISGEPVYVLSTANNGVVDTVLVRRAQVTQDGITYVVEELVAGEIETPNEAIDREYEEMLYRHQLAKKGQAALDEADDIVTPTAVQ